MNKARLKDTYWHKDTYNSITKRNKNNINGMLDEINKNRTIIKKLDNKINWLIQEINQLKKEK